MARKTFVDLSDTLNAFRVKTNVISYNVGDLDSLNSILPDSDLVQAINYLQRTDSDLQAGVDSNQVQIFNNDSDIAAIKLFTGIQSGGNSLQQQITNNDSDILSLQAQITNNDSDLANITVVRTSTLSILKSDGTIAKRIFGFIDSGV